MDIYNHLMRHYIRISFVASFLFLAFAGSMIFIFSETLQQLLIIHFDTFNGTDVLGTRDHIFGILGVGIVLNILNALTVSIVRGRDYFLACLMSFFNLIVTFLLLLTILVIIHVN